MQNIPEEWKSLAYRIRRCFRRTACKPPISKSTFLLTRYLPTSILVQMKAISVLVQTLLQAKTEKEMENLLYGLLTPKEVDEFAQRVEIVRLLKKGTAQHTIAEKLGVGVATVTRGAKEIKEGNFKYVQ